MLYGNTYTADVGGHKVAAPMGKFCRNSALEIARDCLGIHTAKAGSV